jgi:hypothetical protein
MQSTTMTINLRKKLINLHTARRRKRTIGLVKEAVARFSKSDIDKIKIHHELNEFLERNASGASFLWSKLKLNVEKSADKVEVKLYSEKAVPVSAVAQKPEEKKAKQGDESKAAKKA